VSHRLKTLGLLIGGFSLIVSVTAIQMHQLDFPLAYRTLTLTQKLNADLCQWTESARKLPQCPVTAPKLAGLHDHTGKNTPDACLCPGTSETHAGNWNNCLSCLYVTFMGIHNNFARQFASLVDAESELETIIPVDEGTMRVNAGNSPLEEYEKFAQISKTTGEICMSLHYTKNPKDPSRVKAIMHLNSNHCPQDRAMGSHAMAMKFDLKYTDKDLQQALFFQTGEYEGNGFDVTGEDADDIFYMNIEINEEDGPRKTTAWVYRLSKGSGWKYYLNGEDDVLLYVATKRIALSEKNLDAEDLEAQCVDDSKDKLKKTQVCIDSGYAFRDFPVKMKVIASRGYPSWTTQSLAVSSSTKVYDYFNTSVDPRLPAKTPQRN